MHDDASGPAQRIAIFGGSFDPPHLGHVLAVCYAQLMASIDAVWVFPVARHAYHKGLTPWAQRWELCQAAFSTLPFVTLRDDELHNDGGYTFDLITHLIKAYPQHQWSLIGGTDTAADLKNWHRGEELQKLVSIIPVPRRGFDDHVSALPEISSSLIRERLQNGNDVADLVPAAVAQLIAHNKWYK